ncbi:MAG: glycosyltransferase family 4 protein [Candidatus Bathyarchaeota archaeon]
MKVCYVSPEVFTWGVHGGFGFLTRTLCRELVERGIETFVVTVRRRGQGEVEKLDGFTVLGYPSHSWAPYPLNALLSRLGSIRYYREADCDIYHSQAVGYNTLAAQRAMPDRYHLTTFQDPYDLDEWRKISEVDPRYTITPSFRARLVAETRFLAGACRNADALFAQARFLIEKSIRLYGLELSPVFLPNPVELPRRPMREAGEPTVCFLARWDPQKRVDLFIELARELPEVTFIAMGRSHDLRTDSKLREMCSGLPNLEAPGFVSETEKSKILERSWALVNTSVREALPVSFLEALAHETPIISALNPDSLISRFGYPVTDGDYAGALRHMLMDGGRRGKGVKGKRYVEAVHEIDRVVERHIEIYERLLEGGGR